MDATAVSQEPVIVPAPAGEWAGRIATKYKRFQSRTVADIFDIGDDLIAAKEKLGDQGWSAMFDKDKVDTPIPMSQTYAQRFMSIARNKLLRANAEKLPPTV